MQMCSWIVDLTYFTFKLYCVSIEVDFCFELQKGRLCNSNLGGLKLSVNIANPCSKLLYKEVREVVYIKYQGSIINLD